MATGGRPKRTDGKKPTRHVRVKPDIAEMVSWIVRVEKGNSADLLDPLLRGPITTRYELRKKAIDMMKKAEAEVRKPQPGE